MNKGNTRFYLLLILIVIPYIILITILLNKKISAFRIDNSNIVIVDKSTLNLRVYSFNGKMINSFPVSLGKNYGNKTVKNDSKTPEGIFRVMSIEDSSEWSFDFEDDNEAEIPGAYGPWFVRLEVPGQKGIGIHGNLDRYPIGYRNSHGCIRMDNSDLKRLVKLINPNSLVVVVPSMDDLVQDSILNSFSDWKMPARETGLFLLPDTGSNNSINY